MAQRLNPEQLDEALGLQRKGKTQSEIAATLGVDRTVISRALAKYNRRVMQRLEGRAVAEKGRQLERLDYLYSQAVEAWHRSREDAETLKTTDDGSNPPRTETTVKGQAGDAAMLAQARAALADARSILGLDAPKAADITSNGKEIGRGPAAWSNLSTDELLALRSLLARAASPRPDGGDPAD